MVGRSCGPEVVACIIEQLGLSLSYFVICTVHHSMAIMSYNAPLKVREQLII
jgi:hypothetical protein